MWICVQCLEPGNQRFAIDLDFDGLMPEGELLWPFTIVLLQFW